MNTLPKRRKHMDNPYTLKIIEDKYYVLFKDSLNVLRTVKIDENLFNLFNCFELEDLHELNEYDRHIEHKEFTENTLYNRISNQAEGIDDIVIRKSSYDELMNAINMLTNTQKRRIKMYYFDEMNEIEIAKRENTSHQAVHKSLIQAKERLKSILLKQ